MDARDKLFAEVGLTEIKMILGWEWDFRRLKILLPENKFIAWTNDVSQLLTDGTTTAKALESTIGRLGHLALVVPGVIISSAVYGSSNVWRSIVDRPESTSRVKPISDSCSVSSTLPREGST